MNFPKKHNDGKILISGVAEVTENKYLCSVFKCGKIWLLATTLKKC